MGVILATKKYRIMFVIDSLAGGGAERVMAQLANKFNKEIFEVLILMTLGEEIKNKTCHQILEYYHSDRLWIRK